MSNDPKTSIEEQLRAYAAARRRQTPPVFPRSPMTRRALQAAVEREFGEVRETSPAGGWWRRMVWPYGVVCGAGVAVLALGGVVWWGDRAGSRTVVELAKASRPALPETNAALRLAMAPAPATANPGERRVAAPLPAADDSLALREGSKPPPAPTLAEVPSQVMPSGQPSNVALPADAVVGSRLGSAPPGAAAEPASTGSAARLAPPTPQPSFAAGVAPMAAAAPPSEAFGSRQLAVTMSPKTIAARSSPTGADRPALQSGVEATQTASRAEHQAEVLGQWFVPAGADRPRRRNFNSPPPLDLLHTFYVRPKGGEIEITDKDGSVYRGQLQRAAAGRKVLAAARKAARAAVEATGGGAGTAGSSADTNAGAGADVTGSAGPEPQLWFEVRGTNRTLGELVIFDGRLVFTNRPAGLGLPESTPAGPANAVLGYPLNRAAVEGRAVVAGHTQVEIRAVPASP